MRGSEYSQRGEEVPEVGTQIELLLHPVLPERLVIQECAWSCCSPKPRSSSCPPPSSMQPMPPLALTTGLSLPAQNDLGSWRWRRKIRRGWRPKKWVALIYPKGVLGQYQLWDLTELPMSSTTLTVLNNICSAGVPEKYSTQSFPSKPVTCLHRTAILFLNPVLGQYLIQ